MACTRCRSEDVAGPGGWCTPCETAYDAWVRRHSSDVITTVLVGMVVVSAVGLGLPLAGAGYLAGTLGVVAGAGALVTVHRLHRRRRRRQFALTSLPRAYLR